MVLIFKICYYKKRSKLLVLKEALISEVLLFIPKQGKLKRRNIIEG